MICASCKERRHGECRGGSWCDCQHQPETRRDREEEPPAEPATNWLRHG
ncbi:hypothetical protein [Streptosporangium jomthongense]|uniref:Uncharacterized protein n=1 Tax=Streptosporangium jomthongense TaxID=1193683 RepID=A0ABV8F4W9_9ACTN